MAAMCAIKINERIKKFFVRLVHRGKPRKLALVALYEEAANYCFGIL